VIDSDRILVRGKDEQVSYLPNVQWAAQLPGLVQARLLQTFENAKRGGSVARPDDNVVADARLVTEIRRFEIETVGGTTAVVEISAKIVDGTTGRISAAHIFSSRVATGAVTGVAASSALDEALQSVLREIVAWVSPRA
jgi:cholesterol transport system auxiliary component